MSYNIMHVCAYYYNFEAIVSQWRFGFPAYIQVAQAFRITIYLCIYIIILSDSPR